MMCDYGKPPAAGKVCDVDMTTWGQCTKKHKYGYNKSAPCIFLKLNKVRDIKNVTMILLYI